jgi:SAM-dependent methyltransferase
MKQAYAGAYRELHERHWWWRAREAVLLRELADHAPPGGYSRILDIGCGDALLFDELRRFGEVWGVEPDASLLREDGPYRNRIHVGKFDRSFAAEDPFGLVLMLDVLEHMPDPLEALGRVADQLTPSGALLLTVPAFPVLWTSHDDWNEHVVRYTRSSLARLVEEAGLTMRSSRYLFHWLFPAKLVVRAIEAVRPDSRKAAALPPEWLNQALLRLSTFEERLFRGVPLPFGTSLLAWCVPGAQGSHSRAAGLEPRAPAGLMR